MTNQITVSIKIRLLVASVSPFAHSLPWGAVTRKDKRLFICITKLLTDSTVFGQMMRRYFWVAYSSSVSYLTIPSAVLSSAKDLLTFSFGALGAATITGTITYLMDQYWDGTSGKLFGASGLAALTFAGVAIGAYSSSPYTSWATSPAQGLTVGVNDGPTDDPDHDGISNLLAEFGSQWFRSSQGQPVIVTSIHFHALA